MILTRAVQRLSDGIGSCAPKTDKIAAAGRLGVFIPFLLLTLALFPAASCSRQPEYPQAPQSGPNIVIDAATLEPDVPTFYRYPFHGRNISYFALKIDGNVLSFLDACASCYGHRQGYRYEDGAVVCRYCSVRFPVYKLEKGLGSCYPLKIEGRMENGKYVIPVALLEAEAGRF